MVDNQRIAGVIAGAVLILFGIHLIRTERQSARQAIEFQRSVSSFATGKISFFIYRGMGILAGLSFMAAGVLAIFAKFTFRDVWSELKLY